MIEKRWFFRLLTVLRDALSLLLSSSRGKSVPISGVSEETKATILRMSEKGMRLREIALVVGLGGNKYSLFKQACQELGINQPPQKGCEQDS